MRNREVAAYFEAPQEACTLHFVLEVTNAGTPPVTRYARVIVEVEEAKQRRP